MNVFVEREGSLAGFQSLIQQAQKVSATGTLMVMTCDENGFTPRVIDPVLRTIQQPLFGAVFPRLIWNNELLTKGSIVAVLDSSAIVHVISGLSSPDKDYVSILDEQVEESDELKTLMVFVDGLSRRISSFIDALYMVFGLEINYVGGGAGSLSLEQQPCLFTNQGMVEDCAILVELQSNSGIGVAHGWKPVGKMFKVTDADRNILKTLDWIPAFEQYKNIIKTHSGMEMTEENFSELAGAYPFGLAKLESESIIRDPVRFTTEGYLVCVGELHGGGYVDVMYGDESSLVEAAAGAHQKAMERLGHESDNTLHLLIDCISRVLFLGDDFGRELQVAHTRDYPTIGACTLGEIANNGKEYLEFFNKTVVSALLEDV